MSVFSAHFVPSGSDPQETFSSFPTPSSSTTSIFTSPSTFTSTPFSTSASASACEFDVEMGIAPSDTMLSAPIPIYAQHPTIPFLSPRARIAEFGKLLEDLRKTEIIRELQAEKLYAMAREAPEVPQV